VGHQVGELAGPEPAKVVVLLGVVIGIDRGGAAPELLETFPRDGLARQLVGLDVSADEVPAVGTTPT
jgi:hypothetical protein